MTFNDLKQDAEKGLNVLMTQRSQKLMIQRK